MKYNLYVVSKKELKRDGNTLKIDNKKIPLSMIKNVFIFSNAHITDSARNLLLRNSKPIYFLDYKYNLIGMLVNSHFDSNYRVRLLQYKNHQNLDLAKFIVLKKIEAIEEYTNSLNRFKDKLKKADSLNSVLGVEGSVSTFMFKKFKEELEKIGIDEFKKREYRPVKDRVNSLLSFLYTIYYAYLYSEVISEGFDPYIGFLHIKRGKHAAFVSDIMEEARVKLTFLAIKILKEFFEDGFDGIYLKNEARKEVLKEFDNFLVSYENSILKEIKERLC